MSKRFGVDIPGNDSHDVGADEMRVGHGGALEFWINGSLGLVYAPGQWITATFEYEE